MEEVYKEIREAGYSSTETIAQLFLNDPEHGQGVICSGLRCPGGQEYQSFGVPRSRGDNPSLNAALNCIPACSPQSWG